MRGVLKSSSCWMRAAFERMYAPWQMRAAHVLLAPNHAFAIARWPQASYSCAHMMQITVRIWSIAYDDGEGERHVCRQLHCDGQAADCRVRLHGCSLAVGEISHTTCPTSRTVSAVASRWCLRNCFGCCGSHCAQQNTVTHAACCCGSRVLAASLPLARIICIAYLTLS